MNTLLDLNQVAAELEVLRRQLREGEARCAEWRASNAPRLIDKGLEDLQPVRNRIHLLETKLSKLRVAT